MEFAKRRDVFGWAWDHALVHDSSGVYKFEEATFVHHGSSPAPCSLPSDPPCSKQVQIGSPNCAHVQTGSAFKARPSSINLL